METEIREKIRVISLFENGQITPLLFSWRKKIYKILRVVFSYSKNIGREKIFYFSVECSGGMFELSFNRESFNWAVEKVF